MAKRKPKDKEYIVIERTKAFIAQRDFGQMEVNDVVTLNEQEYNILKNFVQLKE